MQGTERSVQTSGILGFAAFLVIGSSVTTASPFKRANAITNGSAPERFFFSLRRFL